MKIKTLFLFAVAASFAVWLTSCLNGDNSQTLTNAYGYVTQENSKIHINTSGGHPITWSGISSSLSPGQCIKLTYTIDGSYLDGVYNATEHNVVKSDIQACSLTNGAPISVNDSNFISSTTITAWHYTVWYGDNWFLGLITKTYPGVGITPKFYYSTNNPVASFDVTKDSVIIDMRLSVSGKASSATPLTTPVECTVDLTPIRAMFTTSSFADKYIPIYFRYYPTVSSKTTTSKTLIYIPTTNS